MCRLLITLLTCGLILGHAVSSLAATYTFDSDSINNNVLIGPPSGQTFVDNYFDVTSEITDLSTITDAALTVYLNDSNPGGIPSWHAARIDIDFAPIGYPVWGENNHIVTYDHDPLIIGALQAAGGFLLHVDFDSGIFLPFPLDGFVFDKAVLSVDTRVVDISVVPVPGAIWLLGSGLAGLLAVRRRKNN